MSLSLSDSANIIEMPQPLGIFSRELLRRAVAFYEAFKVLGAARSSGADGLYPTYFLLAHSIELIFKSYLTSKETSKTDIKKIGHNLNELLDRCTDLNLVTDDDLRGLTATLAEMNSDHDFRYPTDYNLHLPSISWCRDVVDKLLEIIGPGVAQAGEMAEIDFLGATRTLKGKRIRWSD